MANTSNNPMRLPPSLAKLLAVCEEHDVPFYLAADWMQRASRIGAEQVLIDIIASTAGELAKNAAEEMREDRLSQDRSGLCQPLRGGRRMSSSLQLVPSGLVDEFAQ